MGTTTSSTWTTAKKKRKKTGSVPITKEVLATSATKIGRKVSDSTIEEGPESGEDGDGFEWSNGNKSIDTTKSEETSEMY